MHTWHIHIKGLVQGVGFRPFVYRLATSMGLSGTVNNSTDGVHIVVNGSEEIIQSFYEQIVEGPPPNAIITRHSKEIITHQSFQTFSIEESRKPDILI